jgi:hypothetical protein
MSLTYTDDDAHLRALLRRAGFTPTPLDPDSKALASQPIILDYRAVTHAAIVDWATADPSGALGAALLAHLDAKRATATDPDAIDTRVMDRLTAVDLLTKRDTLVDETEATIRKHLSTTLQQLSLHVKELENAITEADGIFASTSASV